jgi:hypothetical protein
MMDNGKSPLRIWIIVGGNEKKTVIENTRRLQSFFPDVAREKEKTEMWLLGTVTMEQTKALLTCYPCFHFSKSYSSLYPPLYGEFHCFPRTRPVPPFYSLTFYMDDDHPYHIWEPLFCAYLQDVLLS